MFKVYDGVGYLWRMRERLFGDGKGDYLWHDLEIRLNVADFLEGDGQPERD